MNVVQNTTTAQLTAAIAAVQRGNDSVVVTVNQAPNVVICIGEGTRLQVDRSGTTIAMEALRPGMRQCWCFRRLRRGQHPGRQGCI